MSEELKRDFIRHELSEWAEVVEERLNAALEEHQIGISGDLKKSISHRILAAAEKHQGRYELIFTEYGRFVDMGVGRQPKGLQSEARKERVIKRDSRGRFLKQGRSDKKWYSKTFYGSLNNLIYRLVNNYRDFIIQNLKQLENERQD